MKDRIVSRCHFLLQPAGSLLPMPQMVSTCLDVSTWPAPSKYARQQQHLFAHGTLPCNSRVASSFRELRSKLLHLLQACRRRMFLAFSKQTTLLFTKITFHQVWRRGTFGNSRASFACASSSCKTATVTSSHF